MSAAANKATIERLYEAFGQPLDQLATFRLEETASSI